MVCLDIDIKSILVLELPSFYGVLLGSFDISNYIVYPNKVL